MNSGAFANSLCFVWAGLKAVSQTLVKTKQLDREGLKRKALAPFQEDSGAVYL